MKTIGIGLRLCQTHTSISVYKPQWEKRMTDL